MIMLTPERDLDLIVEPDVPVDPIVITTLTARISDSDKGIRRTAIRGVGILRGQAAVPELVRVVREDRDDSLRFDGVRSLRKIADASVGDRSRLAPQPQRRHRPQRDDGDARLDAVPRRGSRADAHRRGDGQD